MIHKGSNEDTIAAIATPMGQAGIGIIRISGPRSLEIARKVFCPRKDIQNLESHRLYLGHVKNPASGRSLDEALVCFMRAPYTYTREDVVEINCHSSYLLLARILEIILCQGARLAKPGEFTFRAFMNGRIDLTQAEAIVDLINSQSEKGLQLASEQIKGRLRTQSQEWRNKGLEILATIEVGIDFPDEEIELLPREKTADKIEKELIGPIDKILAAYVQRKIWMEGVRTVIVGRVNAGKSSLLNRLLNEERAIVTPIPGTTRDVVESTLYIEGLPLRLIDTAGFRKVRGRLEGIGLRMTHKKWAEADLALVVIDQSRPANSDDLNLISKSREKKSLILLNKIDLPSRINQEQLKELLDGLRVVRISALTGEGIDDLRRAIRDLILSPDTDINASLSVAPNLRHKQALQKASRFFKSSAQNTRNGLPLEIIAVDINSGLEALAEITGEITSDDLLEKIFSQFCLGK